MLGFPEDLTDARLLRLELPGRSAQAWLQLLLTEGVDFCPLQERDLRSPQTEAHI